jgi:site-specific DNA-cytosine methylase
VSGTPQEFYRLRSVELFVGAGGLALGVTRAGFDPLMAVDFR